MNTDAATRAVRPAKESQRTRPTNPLQAGIQSFVASRPRVEPAIAYPKRYTLYPPLLLLSVNFATHNASWETWYATLTADEKNQLFRSIADAFSRAGHHVTHIAINAPIVSGSDQCQNVIRSPSGLLPVWGNFGPPNLLDTGSVFPTEADFGAALWISTAQDRGVSQVWAPRWTMFSHGNLSEKRRILHHNTEVQHSVFGENAAEQVQRMQVLDLYVGIGYFALCYLARGVSRVWGWDLNPWSIEGLRRGCEANAWRCAVLRVDETGECDESALRDLTTQLNDEQTTAPDNRLRCVAFVGDNKWACKVLKRIEHMCNKGHEGSRAFLAQFDHVNLGLLPTSSTSWPNAVDLVNDGGVLHIHENVQISDIDLKASEIGQSIGQLLQAHRGAGNARVVQVEQVKTYAPGVMHCVFDVHVSDID